MTNPNPLLSFDCLTIHKQTHGHFLFAVKPLSLFTHLISSLSSFLWWFPTPLSVTMTTKATGRIIVHMTYRYQLSIPVFYLLEMALFCFCLDAKLWGPYASVVIPEQISRKFLCYWVSTPQSRKLKRDNNYSCLCLNVTVFSLLSYVVWYPTAS